MSQISQLSVGSFFAGVGGIELGFSQAGFTNLVYANEFDKYACKTYSNNFDNSILDNRDICKVSPDEIPHLDIICGGFPCQAFSIAGLQKGFEDTRGTMFFELLRFVDYFKPKIVFAENVKNLQTHDKGNTFKVIKESLESLGYTVISKVLNACEYGNIPQNRERIYIIGFLDGGQANNFSWPSEISLTTTLGDIIDFENKQDDKYYYIPGKFVGDIYEKLNEAMTDKNSIYQWRRTYVRQNKSGLIPTLTANQGGGGHNVCLIRTNSGEIRKMTPRECFNAQGFPKDYILQGVSDTQLYKQAGNSVCVPVIKRIAEQVAKTF